MRVFNSRIFAEAKRLMLLPLESYLSEIVKIKNLDLLQEVLMLFSKELESLSAELKEIDQLQQSLAVEENRFQRIVKMGVDLEKMFKATQEHAIQVMLGNLDK